MTVKLIVEVCRNDTVASVTIDNGKEFGRHQWVTQAVCAQVEFAEAIGLITTEKLTFANGNYRTMNLNPAIALFSANSEQNPTKTKRTDPAKTEAVLSGSPDRLNIKPFLTGLKSLYKLKPFIDVELLKAPKASIRRSNADYSQLFFSPQ